MRRLREAPRTQDAALPRPTRVPRTSSPPPPRGPAAGSGPAAADRSEEHTSELQSQSNLVCRLLLEKKKKTRQPLSLGPRIDCPTSRGHRRFRLAVLRLCRRRLRSTPAQFVPGARLCLPHLSRTPRG